MGKAVNLGVLKGLTIKLMENRKKDHRAVASALDTVIKFKMVEGGDNILVSVSGGPDSVFLTHVLKMLAEVMDMRLFGFSLDHSTRGDQSGEDLKFVKGLYRDLDIKLFSKKVDVSRWCKKQKLSFQEGARKLRISLLREISEKHGINKIALGHNLDDNIETFLMRMIRGSGAKGLSGISPTNDTFIRPLINTSREDIEDYLEKNNIEFCIDRSNLEDKYIRNRIRNRLIPFIKDNFPSDLVSSIKRSLEILRDEDTFLTYYALDILEESSISKKGSDNKKTIYIRIPIKSIKSNPEAIRRRIVQAALKKILGNLENISYKNIEDVIGLAGKEDGENKWIKLRGTVIVFKINGILHMADTGFTGEMETDVREYFKYVSGKTEKEKVSVIQEIKIGGRTFLPKFNISVRSKLTGDPGDYSQLSSSKSVMDFKKISPPLKVRSWEKGDKFFPLGMKGSKKLQDFFIDNKIPVNKRNKIPVFYDSDKIIWIGNMRIDSRVKVNLETTDFLCLELFEK